MAIKIGTSARNGAANGTVVLLNTGSVEIRTGTRPTNPQAAVTGTVIATFALPAAAFATAVVGVATANAITGVTASGSGTATWFRAYSSAAVAVIDGDVAVSGADMNIQNTNINSGQAVSITSWTHTQPELSHVAILTSDNLYTALSSAQRRSATKISLTTAAGRTSSLWTVTGFPGAGATPAATACVIPTSATVGAWPFTNPTAGPLSYLAAALGWSSTQAGTVIIYDRVLHSGGLNATLTTAQTVGGSTADRGDHVGNQLFIECYVALGSTASNIQASYTNVTGLPTRSTVSQTLIASMNAGSMQILPLQAGDTGVRSVESITLSASTLTAGNFGVTIMRELARIPIANANVPTSLDALALGMPLIADNACLAFAFVPAGAATGQLQGLLSIAQN